MCYKFEHNIYTEKNKQSAEPKKVVQQPVQVKKTVKPEAVIVLTKTMQRRMEEKMPQPYSPGSSNYEID
ncbi:MAG: hypothetical protein PHQ43_14665 [Dehalococcoidales bacterium]|nr:hypothetical protein [Dehalococcoidales bacterium]